MRNIRKREASDPTFLTRQPKYPRVEESDTGIPAGLSEYSGLSAQWINLVREAVKLQFMTWGSRRSTSTCSASVSARPRRHLSRSSFQPPHHPSLAPRLHTAYNTTSQLRPLHPSHTPVLNEFHLHVRFPGTEPTGLPLSSLTSGRYFMQASNATDGSGSSLESVTTGLLSVSHTTSLPLHRTSNDLSVNSAQSEERYNILMQQKSREYIRARKHNDRYRVCDTEVALKEVYDLKRVNGFTSNFEDFKSYINYQARLQHINERHVFSEIHTKEETRGPSDHSSFPDFADISFLEKAKHKLLRTLQSSLVKPFSPYDWQRQEDRETGHRFRSPFFPSPEIDRRVDELLAKKGVISKLAQEQVCDKDLSRLLPCQWLNDELINFYGAMILERSEAHKEGPVANGRKKPLNVHYFNTFFWSKLQDEGYERARLAKWTKKLDIFSKDIVLIPINHNNSHWTGAVINFRRKRIESYDSMNLNRHQVFKGLRQYLDLEYQDKKKKPFDFTGWSNYCSDDTPQQENGYDCGVFTCQFLEALSRAEESFNFSQRDMTYLRRRMIWEIGNVKFLDAP